MPINKEKMAALKKQYGAKKGEEMYYKLENKKKSTMDLLEDFDKLSKSREKKKRSGLKYDKSNHKD